MSELKPCPFCGRTPTVEDCGEHTWFVKCQCGIVQDRLYHQRCDAVRNWNIRFNEPQMVSFREGDTRLYVDPDYLVELYRMVRRDEIVRVIRCKDCKHLMTYNDGTYDCKYLAERMFAEGELNNKPNDFCCWGERKEVEE